jgi:hypothetical protein
LQNKTNYFSRRLHKSSPVVAIAPRVDSPLGSERHRVGPSTRNLRDKDPFQRLHLCRFVLVDTIAVTELTMLTISKGVETTTFCNNCRVKASATDLSRFLSQHKLDQTGRVCVHFCGVTETTKFAFAPCVELGCVRETSRVKAAGLWWGKGKCERGLGQIGSWGRLFLSVGEAINNCAVAFIAEHSKASSMKFFKSSTLSMKCRRSAAVFDLPPA